MPALIEKKHQPLFDGTVLHDELVQDSPRNTAQHPDSLHTGKRQLSRRICTFHRMIFRQNFRGLQGAGTLQGIGCVAPPKGGGGLPMSYD